MPELPPPKLHAAPRRAADPLERSGSALPSSSPARSGRDVPAYAELRCRSNYSFLEGASHPDELVAQAARLGLHALALTDRASLAGVVRAHVAAKEAGLKLLVGAEFDLRDAPSVVLLATDRAAYGRLARLITAGRRRAEKGNCDLGFDDVAAASQGLLACVLPGERPDPAALGRFRDLFADRASLVAERHFGPDDARRLRNLAQVADVVDLPLVAANDVHYHVAARQPLHDVLTAVRHGCPVDRLGARRFPNAERRLKSPAEMHALFAEHPEAVRRSVELADRCTFSLDELRYEYPEELAPPGTTPLAHLVALTWQGARDRYPRGIPEKVRRALEHELRLIEELRYEAYFLTVHDLVRFARSRGILCQGRGSAANSAVCFCLGITSVDPDRIDLLFERFVSKERDEPPDIDVDFEHERREEVIQYVYAKYGRHRAGMTATVITYRPKSAVRDVGKALGLSPDRVDALAGAVEHVADDERLGRRFAECGLDAETDLGRRLVGLVREILGFPRHLSQHVGGLVISHGRLDELVPIENAAMPGRTVVQWDKDDLDALGLLKVDCLALGMLSAIHRAFDLVAAHHGRMLTLADVPPEDPAVYAMIRQADTVGVFQIESRAQMSMLPRLRPATFYDLVIEVAIVRPGPIQGDMVHPYLRRRSGEEPVEYPDERVRSVLQRTLGVPLFQEQAMKLAVVAAGFTPGEADRLRRAMGAWRRAGQMEAFRTKLVEGLRRNGYSDEFGERLWNQIRGFGEYGFPESHAASFALLVYVSAWLKRHYPAAFTCALLDAQPMGFYAPAQLVQDARRHGVEVRPIDVQHSRWECTLESGRLPPGVGDVQKNVASSPVSASPSPRHAERVGHPPNGDVALRLGLRLIAGLPRAAAERIVAARAHGPFRSIDDLARRAALPAHVLQRLARADALASLSAHRRTALWETLPARDATPLFDAVATPDTVETDGGDGVPATHDLAAPIGDEAPDAPEPPVLLDPPAPFEEVVADYRSTGLSLRPHPLSFVRPQLDRLGAVRTELLAVLPTDRRTRVAGLVLLRQRPSTAKGITFVTIEDETGTANLVIHPGTWERFRPVARGASAFLAHGRIERDGDVIHLVVEKLEDLAERLERRSPAALGTRSRDFR